MFQSVKWIKILKIEPPNGSNLPLVVEKYYLVRLHIYDTYTNHFMILVDKSNYRVPVVDEHIFIGDDIFFTCSSRAPPNNRFWQCCGLQYWPQIYSEQLWWLGFWAKIVVVPFMRPILLMQAKGRHQVSCMGAHSIDLKATKNIKYCITYIPLLN